MSRLLVFVAGEGCPQCRLTCQVLDSRGIEYRAVDLTDPASSELRNYVSSELGYTHAPVVVTGDGRHWSGFRPDLLDTLTPPPATSTTPTAAVGAGKKAGSWLSR